ncbi:hypothetical protein ABIE77_000542 [Sinorhizobium fredii]
MHGRRRRGVKVQSGSWGSKAVGSSASSIWRMADWIGPEISIARGVGRMPSAVRRKSRSLRSSRRRLSALDSAGCDMPRREAARLTLPSAIIASKTTRSFRSIFAKFIGMILLFAF